MTIFAAPVVAALLGITSASAAAGPTLRLVSANPFVVSGTSFRPQERVTVRLAGFRPVQRTVLARGGEFRVDFGHPRAPRCTSRFVVASGSLGSRAVLSFPRPLCLPVRPPTD